jgi:DNA (cytosine-5)-methyltransferase 1
MKNNAEVVNPLKGLSPYGWHFEQAVYDVNGIARALKAGGGSGNIPKVLLPAPKPRQNK